MGETCPTCGTHQSYVAAITVDGKPAVKASEILARRLHCGHTLGGEAYEEFKRQSTEINKQAYNDIIKIQKVSDEKKAALWKSLNETISEEE